MKRVLAPLLGLVAAAHAWTFLGAGPIDDAYILFRYSAMAAAGEGFVFNPGQLVEGFSSPLWTVLLAVAAKLGLDLPGTAQVIGLASSFAVAHGLARVGELLNLRLGALAPAGLAAASPAIAFHAGNGLSSVFLAALLVTWLRLLLSAERRDRSSVPAALVLGLACLTRQEVLVFALPFVLRALARRQWLAGLLPYAIAALWFAFRYATYGELLPATHAAKRLPFLVDLGYGLAYLGRGTLESGVGLMVVLATVVAVTRTDGWRVVAGGFLLHCAVVVHVGGDFVPLGRFFVPVLPVGFALGVLGTGELVGRIRAAAAGEGEARSSIGAIGAVVLTIVALQWTQWMRPDLFGERSFFVDRWERLGRYFGEHCEAGTKVALSPVGAFGYYSELPIVDVLGITSGEMADVEPDLDVVLKGHHRYNGPRVLAYEPDIVLLGNCVRMPGSGRLFINPWERDLFLSEAFQRDYVHMLAPIPGDEDLDLWVRRGSPALPGAAVAPSGQ